MSDELTVKKPEHRLKVGSNENYISFEITATQATSKLKADISIPCGQITSDKTYLCADGVRANLIPQSEPAGKLKFLKQPAKATLVSWRSSDFSLNAGEKVKIKITGFNPERDGNADLQLKIGNPKPLYNESHAVSIAPAVGAAIIDFDVSSTSVLQRSKVTITGITTGAKTVKLYADEAEVKALSSNTQAGVTVSTYTHAPEADTTYRLEAADALAGKFAERKIVVSVTSRQTWSSRDLLANSLEYDSAGLHFYPTLLLDAKDLSGETDSDKLYGIFLCKETGQAGLWSSSSGVDDWSFLGNVPDGMAESPGVIHNQALWLIGGSSVDPMGNVSNRVCWYYKDKNQEMVWREWDEDGSEKKTRKTPASRKCHACAAFNGKVWVLGGLSQQNQPLDDVWTCSADPTGGNFTAAWEPSKALPTPRCMPVVTATPASKNMRGVGQPRLWVCGGATHPYNLNETFYDLWSTRDGKTWESLELPKKASVGKIEILAAALFYDAGDQLLHLAGIFRIPGEGFKTRDYELKDANIEIGWAEGSLTGFEWQYTTDLFLIRSVSFRERWIFSPIYQDQTGAKSANARIYITEKNLNG